jgi:subtilisin family serine protease
MNRRSNLSRRALFALLGALLVVSGLPSTAFGGPRQEAGRDVRADIIDRALRAELRGVSEDERIEALFVLSEEPRLEAVAGDNERVVAALQDTASSSQNELLEFIERRGDRVLNTFWIQNMVLAKVKPDTMMDATGFESVARVVPDFEVNVPEVKRTAHTSAATVEDRTWGIDKIQAHRVHDELGLNGAGVRIATLDTGVAIDHPDLQGKMVSDDASDPNYPGGWMEFGSTGNPITSTPHDSAYHGTHVSGTIHGGNTSGIQIGVAPGAEMMHGLVIPGGSGSFTQVAAGMQWAIDPFDASGSPAGEPADIVNMSLGANSYIEEMIAPTRNMRFAGTFPVFAIGNEVFGSCGVGSGSPGNVYEAIGVGATDINDDVADFSCGNVVPKSGWDDPPADWPDSWVTPDISAPGVNVYSADPNGTYRNLNGTSMATPHTAGMFALMNQASPGIGIDAAFDVAATTSFFDDRHGAERPNTRFGEGRINAYEAVAQVAFNSGITGTVTDADSGDAVGQATVQVVGQPNRASTAADGTFQFRLRPGTYDLEISRFGYDTTIVEDVVVTEDQFTEANAALTPLPTGSIGGTVTYEPSGSGIPGVTVTVEGIPVDASDVTDVNGDFTIEGLPEGTYTVSVGAPELPSPPSQEVAVVAGQTAELNFEYLRPAKIGIIGDQGDQFVEFFTTLGIPAEEIDWDAPVSNYDTIIVSYATDPGLADFNQFLADTDAAGTGVIFLDQYFGNHQGIRLLNRHTGNPASRAGGSVTSPRSYYEVLAEHPILDGLAVGEQMDFNTTSSAQWWAAFEGYVGEGTQVIADFGIEGRGRMGQGIAVQQRANNRHVLMSAHGVSATRGPEQWTPDATQAFLNAITWVSPPADRPEARFALWDLQVNPDVVLHDENVTVSARVKNIGTQAGSYTAQLHVDDELEGSQTFSLAPNGSRLVSFTVNRRDVGTYPVRIGPLEGTFRVRAPLVTVQASTLDGGGAMEGATVEMVHDGEVLPGGTTDEGGVATFDAPASISEFTIVVRRDATENHPQAYLLTRAVTTVRDTTYTIKPMNYDTSIVDLGFDAAANRHTGMTYVSPDAVAPWAFAQKPGPLVVTPGNYETLDVHEIDALDSLWWYPSVRSQRDWNRPQGYVHDFGGPLETVANDVRGQQAPTVSFDWKVTDGHGNSLATVLESGPTEFALGDVEDIGTIVDSLRSDAEREHLVRLRLFEPSGLDIRAGTIAWNAQPFEFDIDPATAVPGEYGLRLTAENGPWTGTNVADSTMILPARAIVDDTVAPGGTTEVQVVFDAPQNGEVTLTESLPLGFDVESWESNVEPTSFSVDTWTWAAGDYEPGETIAVTYEMAVDRRVTAGEYSITGEVAGAGGARTVAGETLVTIAGEAIVPTITSKRPSDAKEGSARRSYSVFKIRLDRPADEAARVEFVTRSASAKKHKDFVGKSGIVRFKPGQRTQEVRVRTLNDRRAERTETFKLSLSSASNAKLRTKSVKARILDND